MATIPNTQRFLLISPDEEYPIEVYGTAERDKYLNKNYSDVTGDKELEYLFAMQEYIEEVGYEE